MTLPIKPAVSDMEALYLLKIPSEMDASKNRNGTAFLVWFSKDEAKKFFGIRMIFAPLPTDR